MKDFFIIFITLWSGREHYFLWKVPKMGPFVFQMKAKKKVIRTHVEALRLCTGRTAHRGSRVIALLFLDHSTRRG